MVSNDQAVNAHATGIRMTERADPSTPTGNTLHLYIKDKSGVPTLYAINAAGTVYELAENTPIFTFPFSGSLYVTPNATSSLIVHKDLIPVKAYAYVRTAPVGADIIIDINKGSVSIWNATPSDRLRIVAGSQSGVETDFDTDTLEEGDTLTMDIDQIGASVLGADLTVQLKCK